MTIVEVLPCIETGQWLAQKLCFCQCFFLGPVVATDDFVYFYYTLGLQPPPEKVVGVGLGGLTTS